MRQAADGFVDNKLDPRTFQPLVMDKIARHGGVRRKHARQGRPTAV